MPVHALDLFELGYDVIPLWPDTKKAVQAEWQKRVLAREELQQECRGKRRNIGIRMIGIGVVDLDNAMIEMPTSSSMIVKTTKGFHAYFRHLIENPKSYKWEGGDVKLTGYCVAPPSRVSGNNYEWIKGPVPKEELPLLSGTQLPVKVATIATMAMIAMPQTKHQRLRRARFQCNPKSYIMRIESVQGQNGSAGLVRAIAILRDNHVPAEEAWLALLNWNSTVPKPAWPVEDLERAFRRHFHV